MTFFHRVASSRHRASYITLAMLSLPDNVNLDILKFAVTDLFTQRFTGEGYIYIAGWEVYLPSMDVQSANSLESSFIDDKIFHTLKDADDDKALGADDLSFKFVKSFWNTFKVDVIALLHSFHFS